VSGPRVTTLDTNYERAAESDTPSPIAEQHVKNVSSFKEMSAIEDSMGGLEGVFNAEELGAVSVNRIKYFLCAQAEILKVKPTSKVDSKLHELRTVIHLAVNNCHTYTHTHTHTQVGVHMNITGSILHYVKISLP